MYVTFEPNGGTVPYTGKKVTVGNTYNVLPEPERDGYDFAGWYTEANGGTLVASFTVVTNTNAHVLYAHWVQKGETQETEIDIKQNTLTLKI